MKKFNIIRFINIKMSYLLFNTGMALILLQDIIKTVQPLMNDLKVRKFVKIPFAALKF